MSTPTILSREQTPHQPEALIIVDNLELGGVQHHGETQISNDLYKYMYGMMRGLKTPEETFL